MFITLLERYKNVASATGAVLSLFHLLDKWNGPVGTWSHYFLLGTTLNGVQSLLLYQPNKERALSAILWLELQGLTINHS